MNRPCSKCQKPAEYLITARRESFGVTTRLVLSRPYACGEHVADLAREISDAHEGSGVRVFVEQIPASLMQVPDPALIDKSRRNNPANPGASLVP